MEIKNLTHRIRIGDHWPHVVDISPIDGHSDWGLSAGFYAPSTGDDDDRLRRVELRTKKNHYRLFVFRYPSDSELPEWWQDSELIWQLLNLTANRQPT